MAARNIRCLVIEVSEMNHPLQGERPWPVEMPVERPVDSDSLIRRLVEAIERRAAIRGDASPPVREIDPQSVPRPSVVSDPWRRGGVSGGD
jgi:hypothetical protein